MRAKLNIEKVVKSHLRLGLSFLKKTLAFIRYELEREHF